jgi:hypothetical protein
VDKTLAVAIAAELGMTPQRLQAIRQMGYQQAVQAMEQLKADVKRASKRLALKYHPDRNQADPGPATAKFKMVMAVLQEVQSLRVVPQKPVQYAQWHGSVQWTNPVTSTQVTPQTGYFQWATQPPKSAPGSDYDATQVVFIQVV